MNPALPHPLLATLLLACTGLSVSACAAPQQAPTGMQSGPEVIAHRGGAMHRPENTLPAFDHALELGAEILEFDMVMTADDEVVVYHDGTINPAICVPDSGEAVSAPVRQLTYAQTRELDCGSQVRPIYDVDGFVAVPGARMPALGELLDHLQDGDTTLYGETKMPKPVPGVEDVDPVRFATALEAAIRERGLEDRFILQSSDYRTIDAMHDINPRIRTCLLRAQQLERPYLDAVRRHHASCILLSHRFADASDVRELQDAGVLVYSDVVDTAEDWERYVEMGMDAIFTNHPAGAIDFLRDRGLRD